MDFYATICRLCEAPDRSNGYKWVELFSGKKEHLLAKIRACANIVISDDGLPSTICGRCHRNVERAYNFKVQCEITDAKLRHEIGFLVGENKELPIPPFDYSRFLLAQDAPKQDVILAAEKVYVKTEPDEDFEDEDFRSTMVEAQLNEPGLDLNPEEHKDKTSASEGFDSEDDEFLVVTKAKLPEKPKPKVVDEPKQKGVIEKKRCICDVCETEFDTKQKLITHRRMKHPKHKYQCKTCNRIYSKKQYLDEHAVRHTGIRPYECPQCGKKYFTLSGLKSHVADHGDNLPHVCDKCGKGFASESKLRIHYPIHIEAREFICEICNRGYKTQANLNQHKATHLPRSQQKKKAPRKKKEYVCQYCGKVSTHYEVHNTHVRTHTGDQPFECHICLRRFASWGSHKKHLLVHSGEKPHVCQYCQKAFRQKHHMHTHIRGVHTKETPYQCRFCPRAFATLGNMREHEKSHGASGRSEKHREPTPAVNPDAIPPKFGHLLTESTESNGSY